MDKITSKKEVLKERYFKKLFEKYVINKDRVRELYNENPDFIKEEDLTRLLKNAYTKIRKNENRSTTTAIITEIVEKYPEKFKENHFTIINDNMNTDLSSALINKLLEL
jgi:hypothetical protein